MKITSSLKWGTFIYDFAVDGGAIGTKPMGVFINANSLVFFAESNVITTCTSGGAAHISIGVTPQINEFLTPTAVASLTAGSILPGVDLPAAPVAVATFSELCITISDFALTAGKIQFTYLSIAYGSGGSNFPVGQGIGFMVIGSTNIIG